MSEMMDDFEMSGEEFPIGPARAIVNNIVGQYRKLAMLRMFGALEDPLVGRIRVFASAGDCRHMGLMTTRLSSLCLQRNWQPPRTRRSFRASVRHRRPAYKVW